jgi:hypothetical protein
VSNTWEDVNRRLVGAILALDLYDSLTVGDRRKPPSRRLLGRRPRPEPRRFVQITAAQTVLIVECVGSTSFGGDWPMSPEQENTLIRQGWEKPWSDSERTFQREAPLIGAPRLALATVRALQTLGCEVTALQFDLTREEPD